MTKVWRYIFFKIMKWNITGDVPRDISKFLIIVAPHTSNWDIIIGLFVRRIRNFQSSFLAKSTLFKGIGGNIFRKLGGFPVYRNSKHNMVDQVVKLIGENDRFVLAITPEGTRGNVTKWKTGFYYIAKKTNVPLVLTTIDYRKRTVHFFKPYYITGNTVLDAEYINNCFIGVNGLNRIAAPFVLNEKTE